MSRKHHMSDWDGGKAGWNASHPDKPVEWEACVPSGFRDHEGQVFDSGNGFV